MEETKLVEHYTDSIYYELEKTARYGRFLGVQVFDKLGVDINPSEYATLDTISCNPGLCQRDLAKLILKDRANTGRILDSLEKRGYINRFSDEKNNRLIRRIEITESGLDKLKSITDKIRPMLVNAIEVLPRSESEALRASIRKFRETLSNIVETQI